MSAFDWQQEEPGLWSCAGAEVFISGGKWVWSASYSGDIRSGYKTAAEAKRAYERWAVKPEGRR